MKKNLFLMGVAIATLSGCTQSEVLDAPESRVIKFNSFVDNNARAVTEVESLTTDFYVFGAHTPTSGENWSSPAQAFNNELASTIYYWQPNDTYRFGAYADGSNGKIGNAAFDAVNKKLTFTGYTPDDTKDLIAAISDDVSGILSGSEGNYTHDKVSLSFKHLLSQVKFTIKTDAAATYKLTISDLKIAEASNKGDGEFSTSGTTWNFNAYSGDKGYAYTDLTNGGVISKDVPTSDVKLVLPQSNAFLNVTFTATIAGEAPSGQTTLTKNFTASISYPHDGNKNWKPGYCYNYTAQVDIEDIVDNPDDLVKIEFTPTVESWQTADVPELTPTEE